MYESIPSELKHLTQWVCWKAIPDEVNEGKIKKIPINALTGSPAQSNNPNTWCCYDTAAKASKKYSGIGFMFANGYFGIDIDGIDGDIEAYRAGDSDNIVAEFIHSLRSYSEYSVSGKGLHIICKGSLPPTGRRKKNVEMYESGRFFIMTGNTASEYTEIAEATETVKQLHEKYIGGGAAPTIKRRQPTTAIDLDDSQIIEMAKASKQGAVFSDLYAGSWDIYHTSQSNADIAFCNMLAFWCRRNEAQMDRIFRSSGLMREKWDRKLSNSTYGAVTIAKAVISCSVVYEPPEEYNVTIGDKPVESVKPAERKLYTFDDTGNAQRLADAFADTIRYSYANKKWLYFDNRKWCYDTDGALPRMVDEVVENMRHELNLYMNSPPQGCDPEDVEKDFMKHIKRSRSNKSKAAMILEAQHHLPISPDKLDCHKHLLCTPNGIINLKNGSLGKHDRALYITKMTNIEYSDKLDTPVWNDFLKTVFNDDQDLISFIQRAVGYSLSGSTREECLFFLYGTGRNGKSTFVNVISYILGEYSLNIQPESIMVRQVSNGPTSDIARLKGARFVTCSEPNEGVRLNEGLIKQLTGSDKVTACKKYEAEIEYYPEFKLWMSANHKPVIRGTDTGIWSRIRIIPFTVQISDEQMDKNLLHKLKREMPGILKWAVDGCLLWQRDGLRMAAAVREATAEYRNEMDVLGSFIDECCVQGSGRVKANELFQAYLRWAKENNEYEMTATKFGREMGKRFNRVREHSNYVYTGVSLQEDSLPYKVKFD